MANKTLFFLFIFFSIQIAMGQDLLVFINGYRGPKYDKELPNNQLHHKDPTGYWYQLDDTIRQRFTNANAIYFDAHHPLSTSTHKRFSKALRSYIFSRFCWVRKQSKWVLNQQINEAGFQERVANGQLAGAALRAYLATHPHQKIHFVCHSMGYAYMLGIIDSLENHVQFGKVLILSPEGANTQGRNWGLFEELWQYGARANDKLADPICFQDGIAPQLPVVGIDQLPAGTLGGRIYIPENYPRKKLGFIKSHHLAYYDWFKLIGPTDFGYFAE